MSAVRHIAFVAPRFAENGTVGGAETLLKNLAERFAAAGGRVTFLTTCASDHFSWANDLPVGCKQYRSGFDVHFFPVREDRDLAAFLRAQDLICRGAPYTEADEHAWLANSVNSPQLQDYLRAHAAEFDRIIVGPYLFGVTYFAAAVCPAKTLLVPCLHDEPFARVRAFKKMFQQVGGVVFNSEPERRLGCALFDLPAERTAVVGMGLDTFSADRALFQKRYKSSAPYVLYAGRREAGKGVPLLVDYLNLFRKRTDCDIKLVLLGKGDIDVPAELAPHVYDAGFVSETEKHSAMAGAAVFCQPSTNESFSIVLLEAWLAGTPALVHARCAVTVDHCRQSGGGLWFMTYAEFEEALQLLLQNEKLRRKMGAAGRQYVEREYAWPRIMEKFHKALMLGDG